MIGSGEDESHSSTSKASVEVKKLTQQKFRKAKRKSFKMKTSQSGYQTKQSMGHLLSGSSTKRRKRVTPSKRLVQKRGQINQTMEL